MKIVGSMEVTNGYQHWKEIFMAHEPARKEAGIETIYTGMEAQNPNMVHVCLEVESLEAIQAFMSDPENAKVITDSGVKIETKVINPKIE